MKKPLPNQEKTKKVKNTIVFDAYAWVEYALDGPNADLVAEKLSMVQQALTPATVIGELKEAMLKQNVPRKKISAILNYIKNRSTIVNIDADIAEKAGEINFKHKKQVKDWGMLDSLVYATAIVKKAQVITGDPPLQKLAKRHLHRQIKHC